MPGNDVRRSHSSVRTQQRRALRSTAAALQMSTPAPGQSLKPIRAEGGPFSSTFSPATLSNLATGMEAHSCGLLLAQGPGIPRFCIWKPYPETERFRSNQTERRTSIH
ncbi:uncharacterized protein LOC103161380 isoform X2 [Cricetulus griseus]|uniref:Uncharacterized protein LOC103161380 isoform X2 n=1 Tax=Cricetulus griseus TaxID=10029 RepID=A0A9J7GQE3_CRIGR|nr:uncharacterized protein LOC103161380 isoform X2 [Cricetulus griseus]